MDQARLQLQWGLKEADQYGLATTAAQDEDKPYLYPGGGGRNEGKREKAEKSKEATKGEGEHSFPCLPLSLDKPHFSQRAGSPAPTLSLHRRTELALLRTHGLLTDGRKAGDCQQIKTNATWFRRKRGNFTTIIKSKTSLIYKKYIKGGHLWGF